MTAAFLGHAGPPPLPLPPGVHLEQLLSSLPGMLGTGAGGQPSLPCPVCHKAFANKAGWREHLLMVHQHRLKTCKTCGKQFRSTSSYYHHQREHRHPSEFSYACATCGRKFLSEKSRAIHVMKMHSPIG